MTTYLSMLAFTATIVVILRVLLTAVEPFCLLPIVGGSEFCTTLNPYIRIRISSAPSILSAVACAVVPSAWCETTPKDNAPIETPQTNSIQNSITSHFQDIAEILDTSHRVNDALSFDLQQILLGVVAINNLLKASTLPSHVKDNISTQLLTIRTSTREANECVQGYLAKLNNGVEFLGASAEYTIRLTSQRPPSQPATSLDVILPYPSEKQAFMHTMKSFKDFSERLGGSNKACRSSLQALETKLDRLGKSFHNDAYLPSMKTQDDAEAKLWNILGVGRAAMSQAKQRVSAVRQMGNGLEHLAASLTFLDLHLQKLGVSASELVHMSEQIAGSGTLPIEDVMLLVSSGCNALRQTALGCKKEAAPEVKYDLQSTPEIN